MIINYSSDNSITVEKPRQLGTYVLGYPTSPDFLFYSVNHLGLFLFHIITSLRFSFPTHKSHIPHLLSIC